MNEIQETRFSLKKKGGRGGRANSDSGVLWAGSETAMDRPAAAEYNEAGKGQSTSSSNSSSGILWAGSDEMPHEGDSETKIGDFTNLVGSTIDEILDRIPDNAIMRELYPVQGGATEGFEFKWVQDGKTYRVRVHNSDPEAPVGSNASNGWVVRVQKGKQYYDPTIDDFQPAKYTNPQGDFFDESIMNNTHIPIKDPYK